MLICGSDFVKDTCHLRNRRICMVFVIEVGTGHPFHQLFSYTFCQFWVAYTFGCFYQKFITKTYEYCCKLPLHVPSLSSAFFYGLINKSSDNRSCGSWISIFSILLEGMQIDRRYFLLKIVQ